MSRSPGGDSRHDGSGDRKVAEEALQRAVGAAAAAAAALGQILAVGTVTLTNGVAGNQPTPGIVRGSAVLFTLAALNATTALGTLMPTITPSVGFTVQSLEAAAPASIETGDQSTYVYVVINAAMS